MYSCFSAEDCHDGKITVSWALFSLYCDPGEHKLTFDSKQLVLKSTECWLCCEIGSSDSIFDEYLYFKTHPFANISCFPLSVCTHINSHFLDEMYITLFFAHLTT